MSVSGDETVLHRLQVPFTAVELDDGVEARYRPNNIVSRDFRNIRVLIDRNQNVISEEENEHNGDKENADYDTAAIELHTAHIAVTAAERLRNKCLNRSIEALTQCKAYNINEHIAHSDRSHEVRLRLATHKVDIGQLNDEQEDIRQNCGH